MIKQEKTKEKIRYENLYKSLSHNNKLIHVGLLLKRAAQKWPDNKAVICEDETITYKDLYKKATIFAKKLQDLGVKPNDRVILFYENSIEFYIAYHAVWLAGGIITPLNIFLTELEFTNIIKNAEPEVLIIENSLLNKLKNFKQTNTIPIVSDILKDIENIEKNNSINLDINIKIPDRNLDDTAALLYTSGTTGFPKGVMLTSKNIIINSIQGISRFKTSADDRVYSALPLFHSFPQNTCIWTTVILGATAIIAKKINRHSLISGLKHKPSIIIAVPSLYGLFCKMKSINFGPIRYFASGGDVLPDKIRTYFELIYRRKLCNGYGLTETSPFISVDIKDYTKPSGNVGKPFFGVQCSIRDDNNNELKPGSIGVLWVKGDNIMKGYFKEPEATKSVLKDGWFNSGDLAYIDNNGAIVITGRQKDLIISKGINIYPQEIESLLLTDNQVVQVAVIGMQDSSNNGDGGEFPIAFIATDKEQTTQEKEVLKDKLKKLCKSSLAAYKVPKYFIIKKRLPITATGKIDKKRLKLELKDINI